MKKAQKKTSAKDVTRVYRYTPASLGISHELLGDLTRLSLAYGLKDWAVTANFILRWAVTQNTILPDGQPDWPPRPDGKSWKSAD